MKKIIALAVASAFALPAVAAEISVGGSMDYQYVSTDSENTDDYISSDDPQVNVVATSELPDGMTITATFNIVEDTDSDPALDNGGSHLNLSGAFGTMEVGDVSGALDQTGDWTDIAPAFGGYFGDGGDHYLRYDLPAFGIGPLGGLQASFSVSPSGNNDAVEGGGQEGTLTNREASAWSVTYTTGGFGIYAGREETDRDANEVEEWDSYGIRYSSGPFYIAFETGEVKNIAAVTNSDIADGDDVDYRGVAISYTMGNTVIGAENQQIDEEGTDTQDWSEEQVVFINHSLTDEVNVYVSHSSNGSTDTDNDTSQTAFGIGYSF